MAFILNPDGSTSPKPEADAPQPAAKADGALIIDSDTRNFVKDVIEASMTVPVLVDFWASWCGPCKQLTPILEKLVMQAGGLVRLVKINADENQDLCGQLRIQSLPTVYAFKGGQPVDAFMGALPESQLKVFLERLTGGAKAPIDQAMDEAMEALEKGDPQLALEIFKEVQAQDPANPMAISGVLRAQIALGLLDDAGAILESLPANLRARAEIEAAASALELARELGETGDPTALRAQVEANPKDHQARFDLALALLARNDTEGAIDQLLDLARRDRAWNDEAARKQLVKIFDTLGGTHELTISGRRRLSSVLFS